MLGSGKVLQMFFALTKERGGVYPIHFRKKHWGHATAFLKWCSKEKIDDPLGFIRYRFVCGDHRGYRPKIHQLRSRALAAVWIAWRAEEMQSQDRVDEAYLKLKAQAGTKEEQFVKSLLLLDRGHESLRSAYARKGKPELCLVETDLSGGFHPDSRYCPTCPMASRCVAKLYKQYGFDVVALRRGDFRMLPAHIAAAAVR